MKQRFSRYVWVLGAGIITGVATWKMAGWERSPGYLYLQDRAYLETAWVERAAFANPLALSINNPFAYTNHVSPLVNTPTESGPYWQGHFDLWPRTNGRDRQNFPARWVVPRFLTAGTLRIQPDATPDTLGRITGWPQPFPFDHDHHTGISGRYPTPHTNILALASYYYPRMRYYSRPASYSAPSMVYTTGTGAGGDGATLSAARQSAFDILATNTYTRAAFAGSTLGYSWVESGTQVFPGYYAGWGVARATTWPADGMVYFGHKGGITPLLLDLVADAWVLTEVTLYTDQYSEHSEFLDGRSDDILPGIPPSLAPYRYSPFTRRYVRYLPLAPATDPDTLVPCWSLDVGTFYFPPDASSEPVPLGRGDEYYIFLYRIDVHFHCVTIEGDFETYLSDAPDFWDTLDYYDPTIPAP